MMTIKKKITRTVTNILVLSVAPWCVLTAAGQSNDVTVCIGSDSILRSPASGICPRGTQKIELSGPEINKADPGNDALGPVPLSNQSPSDPLDAIERRIAELEKTSVFEVVDHQGRVILSIGPGRMQLYNPSGTVVAAMGATAYGGAFAARSSDGKVTTSISALNSRLDLRIAEGDFTWLDVGRQEAGNYSLKIPMSDKVIAGIGESKAGTGAIVIGDGSGRPRAAMEVNAGKGSFDIFNADGHGIASLTESGNGGGLLVLTDAASNAKVMMKSNDNRYGVVMAFPPKLLYLPKSGFPASYMLGCAAGPACTP
ncbi:MAG TPA: hypothetical protein VMG82_38340 [Candidatus Sulfotelmatobacter sp.]|nr:hypothetical protein [Candidatus Sulfotelmatobacter sp.]